MNSISQIWRTEILPDGVHKVVLEPRRGFVVSLFILACASWLLFGYGVVNVVRNPIFSIGTFAILFFFLFGSVALAGGIHEARRENHLFLSTNYLAIGTSFFNFQFKGNKSYKNARLKVEVVNNTETGQGQPQVRLSMRHSKGYKVIYVSDYAFDLPATLGAVKCFGQYVSDVTGWPVDFPK